MREKRPESRPRRELATLAEQASRDKRREVDRSRVKTRDEDTAKRRKGDDKETVKRVAPSRAVARPLIARPASAAPWSNTVRTAVASASRRVARRPKSSAIIERVADDGGPTPQTPHTVRSVTGAKALKAKMNLQGSDVSRLGFVGADSDVPSKPQQDESHLPDHACGARERRVRDPLPCSCSCCRCYPAAHATAAILLFKLLALARSPAHTDCAMLVL